MNEAAQSLRIVVITVSDTRTLETDKSGQVVVDYIAGSAHVLAERWIILDEEAEIRQKVQTLCESSAADVVILTGGTGITARDVTPEAVEPLFDKTIVGFGELFRQLSYEEIGAATIQSRALAGVASGTLIFALPGSTGAVKLAIEKIIAPQLDSRTRPCNFVQLLPRLRS